jgi:hypothetical protein
MVSCLLVKPPSGHPFDSLARRAAPSTRHALRQGRYKSLIVEEDRYLAGAGGLSDTTVGRKKYREYLAWLAADSGAQKELLFDRMCRGWAIGSKDFKKDL